MYFQPRDWVNARMPPTPPLAAENKALLVFIACAVGLAALQLLS